MASVDPHGDEVSDEGCEICSFMELRHRMLQLAVDCYKISNSGNPQREIVGLAKAFEAYLVGEEADDAISSGTH